jgi:hypothetical protein
MLILTAFSERSNSVYFNLILGLVFSGVVDGTGLDAVATRGGAGGGLPLPER